MDCRNRGGGVGARTDAHSIQAGTTVRQDVRESE